MSKANVHLASAESGAGFVGSGGDPRKFRMLSGASIARIVALNASSSSEPAELASK